MRVLALVASPRRGGNTDVLVDAVLTGAQASGLAVDRIYLHDLSIGPCVDCRGCKSGDRVCLVDDDMGAVFAAMDAADVLVFATPVYWWGPTGVMKQALDRLRPYFANRRLEGKRALVVAPAKDGPSEADMLVEMFRRVFLHVGVEYLGQALGTAYERGDIRTDLQAMEQAKRLGRSL